MRILYIFIYGVVAGLCFGHDLIAQPGTRVKISINMNQPISDGWFDPDMEKVGLRGDFRPLSWGKTFLASDEDEDGIYTLLFEVKIESDSVMFAYKIKVDGENNQNDGWQDGQNRQMVIYRGRENNNSIAWEDEIRTLKPTFTGNIEIIKDFSGQNLASRELQIYLPPDYDKTKLDYPVIYMHDGQNIFDATGAGSEWGMDETVEGLIKSGEIEPVIIVGIGNTADRMDEYTPSTQIWEQELRRVSGPNGQGSLRDLTGIFVTSSNDSLHIFSKKDSLLVRIPGSHFMQELILQEDDTYFLPMAGINLEFIKEKGGTVSKVRGTKPPMGGKGDIYSEFLMNQLIPFIEENYRVKKGKEYRSLGGSSLGGLITAYIGINNPEHFANLFIISPSIWWDNKMILKHYQKLPQSTNQRIFLYMGTNEGVSALENAREFKNLLTAKGWNNQTLLYVEGIDAGHNERAWAAQVEGMLKYINHVPD